MDKKSKTFRSEPSVIQNVICTNLEPAKPMAGKRADLSLNQEENTALEIGQK